MSEHPEDMTTETGVFSVDDETQLQPEDTLDDEDRDVLDTGYSPPDSARGSRMWGTTAREQALGETIDQRIEQEVPDPHSAYGAPHNESGLDDDSFGGDDVDSVDADDDWSGKRQTGRRRAGRLVAPDEGAHEDVESEVWGSDVGIDGGAATAEEAAMHVIDSDDDWDDDDDDDDGDDWDEDEN